MKFRFYLILSESKEIPPVWLDRYVVKAPEVGDIIFFKDDECLKEEVTPRVYNAHLPRWYEVGIVEETGYVYCSTVLESSFLVL